MKNSVKMLAATMVIMLGTSAVLAAPAKNAKTEKAVKVEQSAPVAVAEPVATTPASSSVTIAIVDIPKVVASSSQVEALKKEQEAKAKELVAFVEKARKDVAATSDVKKKQSLEEKYNKELNAKKEAMDKNYASKLSAIDASISKQIANIAKANGYSMVVAKGIVLYGGVDITDKVIKAVK